MNRKIGIVLGAAVVALVAAIVSWRVAVVTMAAEAERTALLASGDSTKEALRRLRAEVAAAEARQRQNETALAVLYQAPAGSGKNAAVAAKPEPSSEGLIEAIQRDPKLQILELAARRAEFQARYGPLIQKLQLTPAQIAKLEEARAKSIEVSGDIQAIMSQHKLSSADPTIRELKERAAEELRTTQLEALGSEGYGKLQEYERTLPARGIVGRLAAVGALNDVPWTAEQVERLTAIIAAAAAPPKGESSLRVATIDWAVVDAQAPGVLSAVQLALFQQTEPVGGGNSRWSARLSRAMDEAQATLARPGP